MPRPHFRCEGRWCRRCGTDAAVASWTHVTEGDPCHECFLACPCTLEAAVLVSGQPQAPSSSSSSSSQCSRPIVAGQSEASKHSPAPGARSPTCVVTKRPHFVCLGPVCRYCGSSVIDGQWIYITESDPCHECSLACPCAVSDCSASPAPPPPGPPPPDLEPPPPPPPGPPPSSAGSKSGSCKECNASSSGSAFLGERGETLSHSVCPPRDDASTRAMFGRPRLVTPVTGLPVVYGECLSFEQRCNKALLALRPNALRWEAPWTSLGSATRLIARNPPPLPSVARPSVQSDWALSDPRPLRQQKALEEKQEEDERQDKEEERPRRGLRSCAVQ